MLGLSCARYGSRKERTGATYGRGPVLVDLVAKEGENIQLQGTVLD